VVVETRPLQLFAQKRANTIEIFKLDVEEYPQAENPYGSLREAYVTPGVVELTGCVSSLARDIGVRLLAGSAGGLECEQSMDGVRDASLEVR
jgi:hypothetical protein